MILTSKTPVCQYNITYSGPEEAQGLQRFWPLHHLAFKFLNLSIMLTCVHFINYCVFLCCVLCIIVYYVDYDYT